MCKEKKKKNKRKLTLSRYSCNKSAVDPHLSGPVSLGKHISPFLTALGKHTKAKTAIKQTTTNKGTNIENIFSILSIVKVDTSRLRLLFTWRVIVTLIKNVWFKSGVSRP
jgi:hypothetical protein